MLRYCVIHLLELKGTKPTAASKDNNTKGTASTVSDDNHDNTETTTSEQHQQGNETKPLGESTASIKPGIILSDLLLAHCVFYAFTS